MVPGAESAQAQGFRSSSCESKSRHVLPRVRRVLRCRTLFHTFSDRSVHYYEASVVNQLHSAYIRTHYHTLCSYPRVRTFVTRATCISSVGMKELSATRFRNFELSGFVLETTATANFLAHPSRALVRWTCSIRQGLDHGWWVYSLYA